jgi:hypothetical protein
LCPTHFFPRVLLYSYYKMCIYCGFQFDQCSKCERLYCNTCGERLGVEQDHVNLCKIKDENDLVKHLTDFNDSVYKKHICVIAKECDDMCKCCEKITLMDTEKTAGIYRYGHSYIVLPAGTKFVKDACGRIISVQLPKNNLGGSIIR